MGTALHFRLQRRLLVSLEKSNAFWDHEVLNAVTSGRGVGGRWSHAAQAALGLCSPALGPRPASPFAPFTLFHLYIDRCVNANSRFSWRPALLESTPGPLRPMSTHCCLFWPLGPLLSMGDHVHTQAHRKLPPPHPTQRGVHIQRHAVPFKGIFQLGCVCPVAWEVFF